MREATLMFTQTSASIVLVEDHTILREGLRALIELEPDLKVIGEARTAAEGVRVVQDSDPTLVITDLAMPGGSGLRSEEHTSELQSQSNLVCRLLLEKKKKQNNSCVQHLDNHLSLSDFGAAAH